MPNRRFKSENYENIGGINTKADTYLTGPREVLDLRNYDFSTPGSLTTRPGSTMYFGQTFSGKILNVFEYEKLSGASYLIVSHSGGIWAGATPLVGWSILAAGATYFGAAAPGEPFFGSTTIGTTMVTLGTVSPNYTYNAGSGAFVQAALGTPEGITLVGNLYGKAIYNPPQICDVSLNTYNDTLYVDGSDLHFKFNGSTFYSSRMPILTAFDHSCPGAIGGSLGFSVDYKYAFYVAGVDENGTRGPLNCIMSVDAASAGVGASIPNVIKPTFSVVNPKWFGITALDILVWRGATNAIVSASQTKHFTTMAASASLITGVLLNTHGISLWDSLPPLNESLYNNYIFGSTVLNTYVIQRSDGVTLTLTNVFVDTNQNQPRFTEVNQNRIFFAGFSDMPSTVWFSELGQPENVDPTFNYEARTNDGDYITGIKDYQNSLMNFKSRSTHQLDGDAPENFVLRQITSDYGCVNKNCRVTYKQVCWFLDKKGVIEFNGANINVVSTKIEPIINTINWDAAKLHAIMLHNKPRNEIWIGVPVNGSSTNNITLVFDYIMQAWTIWDGFSPSYFAMLRRGFGIETGFYGDNSGRLNYFGTTLYGDNSGTSGINGITSLVKFRYEHPEGQSVEKLYRRLFVNCDSINGISTYNLSAEYFKNYSASLVLSQTISQTKFQKYINFGISAKSLSIQVSNYTTSDKLRLHGYVLEYRYQRST